MSEQLPLGLPPNANATRRDFFLSPANELAMAEIDRWETWPHGKLLLTGPAASGKSHLGRIWAALSGAHTVQAMDLDPRTARFGKAVLVEDVHLVAGVPEREQALLHLHNLTLAEQGRLLMTGLEHPAQWNIRLPDLNSRISGTQVASIGAPDDALMQALLVKHFGDRGLAATPALVAWLSLRIERSYPAAREIVEQLDAATLRTGRPLGMKLAGELLGLKDNASSA